jgi:O-antigen ligase
MIALLAVFQARTLYIALPLALLALGWLTHTVRRIVPEFFTTLAVGLVVITFIGSLGIQGSEGPVNLPFLESHASTIVGDQGPHSATITAREDFWHETLSLMASTRGAYLTGLGLGPNLTFGQWTGNVGQQVRTPHNAYLEVFARTGILGFSLWIWLLLACLIPIARVARQDSGLRGKFCAWCLVGGLVILCVAGFQPVLTFPYGTVPLYFVLGMGVAAAVADPEGSAEGTDFSEEMP